MTTDTSIARGELLHAVTQHHSVRVDAYCLARQCGVYDVTLVVKDRHHDLAAHLTAAVWLQCPACGTPLTACVAVRAFGELPGLESVARPPVTGASEAR